MLALPALLRSVKTVCPLNLFVMVALPAVVNASKTVELANLFVIAAFPAVLVSVPKAVPNTVVPPSLTIRALAAALAFSKDNNPSTVNTGRKDEKFVIPVPVI